jgi:hypothetical protein
MNKQSIREKLDYVPFLILLILAAILIIKVIANDVGLLWKHNIGFVGLLLITVAFFISHKVGVLAIGFVLLCGLLGLLSFSSTIEITTFFVGKSDFRVTIFYGQPVFLVWIIIHLLLSGKYYFGIGTKKYWIELLSKKDKQS